MYFSRITFVPTKVDQMYQHFKKGLYYEHQMIWDLMPKDADAKRDFLYHRDDTQAIPFYYLLSTRKPENSNPLLHIKTTKYAPQLKQGDLLQFNLIANAVKTTKVSKNSKKRKRQNIIEAMVDVFKEKHPDPNDRPSSDYIHHKACKEWLEKQGDKCGFEKTNLIVQEHNYHAISHKNKRYSINRRACPKNHICFSSVNLTGQIRVTNPDLFLEKCFFEREKDSDQLIAGLGRSKAFGCGLMLIRRV